MSADDREYEPNHSRGNEPPHAHEPRGGQIEVVKVLDRARSISLGQAAVRLFRAAGIAVNPSSRLVKSIQKLRQVEALNVQLGPDDPAMEQLTIECFRTVFEFSLFAGNFAEKLDLFKPRILDALGGQVEPQSGRADRARDTQAELLAAIVFDREDAPVRLEEPDLLIALGGRSEVPVAVKRLHSEKSLGKRLREARDQIARLNRPGIIVVNAERLISDWYRENRDAEYRTRGYRKAAQWLDDVGRVDPKLHVQSVALICSDVRLKRVEQSFSTALLFYAQFLAKDLPGAEQAVEEVVRSVHGSVIARMNLALVRLAAFE